MKKFKRILSLAAAGCMLGASALTLAGCANTEEKIVLRVCSWEEYIDLGGWDEAIDLESGDIIGVNSMVDDFTEWFNSDPSHGFKVKVEYSTFGTNEDLYNRLSLGDVYDLVCPSDYMLMKLIDEGNFVEFSDGFRDKENEENYYANFVSPYIDGTDGSVFNTPLVNTEGKPIVLNNRAACYMWGTLGLVYNPEKVATEDVTSWGLLLNDDYARQVTIKDNVRDAYFATLGILNGDELTTDISAERRSEIMNATDSQTIAAAEDLLKQIKDNVYSFETDAGKADMVTGKVVANEQWSGDAVFIMDEADNDGTELWYSVPDEGTDIWFDGWLKLKNGVNWTDERHEAAEAFVNFLSRPDNAVRNMYYIGYTSAIAGDTVFDYMEWNYGAESEDTVSYDLSYFFGEGSVLTADASEFEFDGENINRGRQLFAQYPPQNVIDRSVVMLDFGDKLSEINQMWINVRCLDVKDISPVTIGIISAVIGVLIIAILLYVFRYKLFINNYKPKKGYRKVENSI